MQLAGPAWRQTGQLLAVLAFLGGLAYLLVASTREAPGGQRVFEVRGPAEVSADLGSLGGHQVRIGDCTGSFPYDQVGSLVVHGATYRGFVLEGTRRLVALLP